MNRQQKLVRNFNRAINTDRRETPGIPSTETRLLRARLILEEALEVVNALGFEMYCGPFRLDMPNVTISPYHDLNPQKPIEPNLTEAIDGLCDLNYVSYGTADALGVDLDPFFEEVHASNLAKVSGPKDAHGKQQKPPGWKPPRIKEMLEKILDIPQDQQSNILKDYAKPEK